MSPLARVALILSVGVQGAHCSASGGWKPDGYHVFPEENIQEALDAAALNPTNKTVKVHAGIYRPKGRGQALVWFNRAHDGIHLEAVGEVTLTAANPELSDNRDPTHPAVVNHVVYFGDGITEATVLQGFRITGANHFVTTQLPEVEPNASLKRNLYFYADGGAIKIFGRSSPTLRQLEIADNYASPCAGGISVQQQWPTDASASKAVNIQDCVFRQNRSQITGAAVDLLPGSSAVISNCLFIGNVANLGVNYISANKAQPEFTNSAPLTVFPTSRAVVQHCTFTGNRNGVDDLGHQSVYRNCIFWRNDLGGAFYGGQSYDLDIENEAQVSGCVFGGSVIDPRGVVSKKTNAFNAPDPKFDAHFLPGSPEYLNAGARSPIFSTNLPRE
jgi:parallel beta helix pectate lyase-like protein